MDTLEQLEKQREELEKKIAETRKRLPAHSTKPPIMMALLALEDEYERIILAIRTIKTGTPPA